MSERESLFYSALDEDRKRIYTDSLNTLEVSFQHKLEFEDNQLMLELSGNTDQHFLDEYIMYFYFNMTGALWDNVKNEWSYFTFESTQRQSILDLGNDYVQKRIHD